MHSTPYIKFTRKTSSRRLHGWILFSLPLIACGITSCGKLTPVVYSEFVNIGDKGIPQYWDYTFSPVPFDSTELELGHYDVILIVRYSNKCVSRSVIFDIESFSITQSHPDSTRVEIPLFKTDGVPVGKGNFGVFEITDTLSRDIKLPEGYVISISTPIPEEETKGIIDIGIKLSRTGQTELNIPELLKINSKQ